MATQNITREADIRFLDVNCKRRPKKYKETQTNNFRRHIMIEFGILSHVVFISTSSAIFGNPIQRQLSTPQNSTLKVRTDP
jgi:hypothetical protein